MTFAMIFFGMFHCELNWMRMFEKQFCFFLQEMLHLQSVLAVFHSALALSAFCVHSIVSALIITHAQAEFSLISLPHPFPTSSLKKMMTSHTVPVLHPPMFQIIPYAPCMLASTQAYGSRAACQANKRQHLCWTVSCAGRTVEQRLYQTHLWILACNKLQDQNHWSSGAASHSNIAFSSSEVVDY